MRFAIVSAALFVLSFFPAPPLDPPGEWCNDCIGWGFLSPDSLIGQTPPAITQATAPVAESRRQAERVAAPDRGFMSDKTKTVSPAETSPAETASTAPVRKPARKRQRSTASNRAARAAVDPVRTTTAANVSHGVRHEHSRTGVTTT